MFNNAENQVLDFELFNIHELLLNIYEVLPNLILISWGVVDLDWSVASNCVIFTSCYLILNEVLLRINDMGVVALDCLESDVLFCQ